MTTTTTAGLPASAAAIECERQILLAVPKSCAPVHAAEREKVVFVNQSVLNNSPRQQRADECLIACLAGALAALLVALLVEMILS